MARRRCRPWLIALVLIFVAPVAGAAESPQLEGLWLSAGHHPDGTEYPALVQIVRHGPSVLLTWIRAEPSPTAILLVASVVGVGIVNDNILAVSFYGPEVTGVGLYRIAADSQQIDGQWMLAGADADILNETLSRLPAEDSFDPEEGTSAPVPAVPMPRRRDVALQAPSVPLSPDAAIARQLESWLFDAGLLEVVVSVKDRRVTLTGTVDSLWLKNRALRQARGVRSVKQVVDALTVVRGESDESMARDIAADVSASPQFTIFDDVQAQVMDGVATLTGFVTAPGKSREFLDISAKVAGVQEIVNRIEILPMSMMDDDLRYAVALAIYGSSFFAPYATPHAGPVHIIVRAGHVILTGVVRSEAERHVAELLAHQAIGVHRVENQLRIEEE